MPNEICYVLWDLFFSSRIYGTQSFFMFFFSFITNSTSRTHRHKTVSQNTSSSEKMGGSGLHTCWRTGLSSSSLSSLLFCFFSVFVFFKLFAVSFLFWGICLSTHSFFRIHNRYDDCSAFDFCLLLLRPEDRIHLKAKCIPNNISYVKFCTNNKAPYETLSLPREKGV